jgi:hypothetical protein
MIKVVFMIRRREGMTREDFQRYWREEHAEFVKRQPDFCGVAATCRPTRPSSPFHRGAIPARKFFRGYGHRECRARLQPRPLRGQWLGVNSVTYSAQSGRRRGLENRDPLSAPFSLLFAASGAVCSSRTSVLGSAALMN